MTEFDIEAIRAELVEPGVLHAGVNLGNILLVTGKSADGGPEGVSPDMAKGIADKLGVKVKYNTFPTPGEVADAVAGWDIGLIAIEPKRAEVIAFCSPYVEIEATYLVPAGSKLQTIEDVDQPGIKIAVSDRSAYDLYLSRTLKHAELVRAKGLPATFQMFKHGDQGGQDALAGLVPALKENSLEMPGSRLIPGRFTTVTQAIGTRPAAKKLNAFVEAFIQDAKGSGLVQTLIDKHGVTGKLEVASD
ncbi:MAG: transporter substrate-binding domain-containing protein [Rhodospirillaceae bacterium]